MDLLEAVTSQQHTGNCVDLHACSDAHSCTRYCQITHLFGNVYQCAQSGQTHVCDQNCTQRVEYDNVSTICRLSRKVFYHTPEELMARQSNSRKRSSGENANTFCSPHKRNSYISQPLSPFGVYQPFVAQVGGSPFGTACMM